MSQHNSFIVGVFTFVLCLGAVFNALANQDADKQIIFQTKPDIIAMPEDPRAYRLAEVSISDSSLRNILEVYQAETVILAFRDFDPADTLGFRPDGRHVRLADMRNIYKVTFTSSAERETPLEELRQNQNVIFADYNGYAYPAGRLEPNDPYFQSGYQWGLDNYGQSGGVYDADINAPEAWSYTTGSEGVTIAVLDWGVQDDHEDLVGRVTGDAGYSGWGHGYFVAGILGANTDNDIGIAGVNWESPLISQRVDDQDDEGCYWAVMDAVNSGADILNNSWVLQTVDSLPRYSTVVRKAFANVYKLDRVATACMGNEGFSDPHFPAAFGQGIIAVGSMTHYSTKHDSSNTGHHIDVVAPGELLLGVSGPGNEDYYDWAWGTSFATPHVSGVASLLKSYEPTLANDDIENIINIRAREMGAPGWDDSTGHGLVRADSALELLQLPNALRQLAATSPIIHSISDDYVMYLFDVPGLVDGKYIVKRYELRRSVTFDSPFYNFEGVWGRGAYSDGYSDTYPNFGMGFCDVIDGSVTSSGCTFRTFVYDVWTLTGDHAGYKPCSPSQASMAYSTVGERELQSIIDWHLHQPEWGTPYLKVGWQDGNCGEEGMVLQRKDATSGVWQVLDTLPPSDSIIWMYYEDNDFLGSETYTYRVKPYTRNQPDGPWSEEMVIKARPMPPENVQCEVGSSPCCPKTPSNLIRVSWTPPQNQLEPIDHYVVFRWVPPGGWQGDRFGPIYDTVIEICPNPVDDDREFYVFSFDSDGDSSAVLNYCAACAGSWNACPDQLERSQFVDELIPTEFALHQNYPNPFNATTRIIYELPKTSHVKIEVFNVMGQQVTTLIDVDESGGIHTVEWNANDQSGDRVASGVYLYRLTSDDFTTEKKMVLLK